MKEIQLNNGYVALVDDEDYEWLNQWKWGAHKKGNRIYVERSEVLRTGKKSYKTKTIAMHRLIMDAPKDMEVDHINHNGLDNQRNNLRICTGYQNRLNRKAFGSCKYLGVTVTLSRNYKQIRARVHLDGIVYHLGSFKTEESAAMAYDAKAKELFGEFANLNFK
jgi:hypothetical protein